MMSFAVPTTATAFLVSRTGTTTSPPRPPFPMPTSTAGCAKADTGRHTETITTAACSLLQYATIQPFAAENLIRACSPPNQSEPTLVRGDQQVNEDRARGGE